MNYKFKVTEVGQKLAPFIKGALKEKFSLKLIKKTIEKGACRLNGRMMSYSNHLLKKGDEIEIVLIPLQTVQIETLYEDEFFLIINKPQGVMTDEKTLNSLVNQKVLLVHRLDKETSGLLILAKTPEIKKKFEALFREKSLIKRYLGIVDGQVLEDAGTLEAPLEETKRAHHAVYVKKAVSGPVSLTFWKKLAIGGEASFLQFEIKTGSTHQIRAHADLFNHPLLGDPIYAKKPVCKKLAPSLMLHAYYLAFIHPVTQARVESYAHPPKPFMEFLKGLMPHATLPDY